MKFLFATYMKDVAVNLQRIQHTSENPKFFKIDNIASLEGFLTKMRKTADIIMLIDTSVDGHLSSSTDNYVDNPAYKFYILGQVKLGDAETLESNYKECKKVGYKILSKMLKDKNEGTNGLNYLDLSHVPYISVGPLANGWHGVEFFFTLKQYDNELVYEPNDWL